MDIYTRLEYVLDVLVHAAGADGGVLASAEGSVLASIGLSDAEVAGLGVTRRPRSSVADVQAASAGGGRLRCECMDVCPGAHPSPRLVLCVRDDAPSDVDMVAITPYLPGARRVIVEATAEVTL